MTPHKAYVLHKLTLKLIGSTGQPESFGIVIVSSVQDGRLFNQALFVAGGSIKLEVPAGRYSIMSTDFEYVDINPELTVDADTTVTMDARDASVKPSISVPGAALAYLDVTIDREAAAHGGFTLGISGGRRVRLSPVPSHLRDGSLVTELAGTLTAKSGSRGANGSPTIVLTKDVFKGVPSSVAITHPRSDFAIVQHRYFANGPDRDSFVFIFPFTKYDVFAFISGLPIRLGSTQTLWLQAGADKTWLQDVYAFLRFAPFRYGEMGAPFTSYSPGVTKPLNFFRGPVGPGLERGTNRGATGRLCSLCRDGRLLRGSLPLFNAAGTRLVGGVAPSSVASWSLTSGRRRLQSGSFNISPKVDLPAKRSDYTLTASSHPDLGTWRLSTEVTDTWGFSSATGHAVVPLLMASYVPTNALDGYAPSGRQSYRLNFDNLGPEAARVTRATLEYSVLDHGGWHQAKVTRLDKNSFRVSYPLTYNAGRNYVNLRVTAKDARGRTVIETALRAYRVSRPGEPLTTTATNASYLSSATTQPREATTTGLRHPLGAKPVCGAVKAHHARCYALLERHGAAALDKAGDPKGYNAIDLRDAYGLDSMPTNGQTVAVVVAYDYPSAEADMNSYRRKFGLPTCTQASGCFTKINQSGQTSHYPSPDQGWALEAALDLQMISASCPTCHIILAEGNSNSFASLTKTNDAAVDAGAVVINHSFGGSEFNGIRRLSGHYNVAGVTGVASTGDSGYEPAQFPASSPSVVSVGGTVLRHATNPRGWKERAWSYGGSGCSAYFAKPAFQSDPACGMRMAADVSAIADSVAVYDTFLPRRYQGWVEVGGTSISSPFVSGMIAAAGAGGIRPGDLYGRPHAFHDITKGANGFCRGSYVCTAKPGYDGPTGVGSPRGLGAF